MEAVAAVGSVLSIVGILGQSIQGILKLRKLVRGVSNTSRTWNYFTADLEDLEHALKTVLAFVEQIPEDRCKKDERKHLDTLIRQVERCRVDIDEWVAHSRDLDVSSTTSRTRFLRRIRIHENADDLVVFHRRIATHMQGFQFTLNILGRSDSLI